MEFSQFQQRARDIRKQYAAYEKKMYGREWTTEEIALGLMSDVGDLAKLVAAKEGVRATDNLELQLRLELSEVLLSTLTLADKYGLSLETDFMATMDSLERRLRTA